MPEVPRRQPTLDEVAERAGVSRTAASRVLNNAPHVSKAKRDAVQKAIRELGYIPNATARALATRQAGSWWEDWTRWSQARAGNLVRPPSMGSSQNPAVGNAPGGYVLG